MGGFQSGYDIRITVNKNAPIGDGPGMARPNKVGRIILMRVHRSQSNGGMTLYSGIELGKNGTPTGNAMEYLSHPHDCVERLAAATPTLKSEGGILRP